MLLLWQTTSTDTQPVPFYCMKQKCLKTQSTHRCSLMQNCKRENLEGFLSPFASSAFKWLASNHLQVITGLQQRGVFVGKGPSRLIGWALALWINAKSRSLVRRKFFKKSVCYRPKTTTTGVDTANVRLGREGSCSQALSPFPSSSQSSSFL